MTKSSIQTVERVKALIIVDDDESAGITTIYVREAIDGTMIGEAEITVSTESFKELVTTALYGIGYRIIYSGEEE